MPSDSDNNNGFRPYDINTGKWADEDATKVLPPIKQTQDPEPEQRDAASPGASSEALVPAQRRKPPAKKPPGAQKAALETAQKRKSAASKTPGASASTPAAADKKPAAPKPVKPLKTMMQKKPSKPSLGSDVPIIDIDAQTVGSDESPAPAVKRKRPGRAQRDNAVTMKEAGTAPAKSKASDDVIDTGPADFNIKFDFEGKYMDVPEERPLRWRREKRTGCIGGILYSAFVICASILLASLAWIAASDVLGFGTVDEEINMTISKDFEMEDVIELLYDAGLIKYRFLFRLYAGFSSAESKITAGSYVLNKNFDYRALVHGMTARGGARVEVTVQIPEGYTLLQIFALLEEKNVCTAEELWRSATWHDYTNSFLKDIPRGNRLRLEGYLFPDTYNFYVDSQPEQAISKMLGEFGRKFTEQYTERAEYMGYTMREIITIASMIEREAGNDEERPHIASVIYNRMRSNDFSLLQIDATIYYAIAGTGIPFSTSVDSPYNTYQHTGLPPGPISNPGLASIRAALYPSSTGDYYYALNREGSHNFFKTLAQQQAFVNSDEYGG